MTAGQETIPPTSVDVARGMTGPGNPTGAQLLASFPPRQVASSWPATEASRSQVLARVLAAPFTLDNRGSQQTRRLGVLAVLSWLATYPGASWQDRWRASSAEDHPDWRELVTASSARGHGPGGVHRAMPPHLSPGLLVLICAEVIRPSLGWLLRFAPVRRGLAIEMARTRDAAAFAELTELCTHARVGLQTGQQALTRVAVIMAAWGGPVGAVRVGDCVELLQVSAGLRATSEAHAHSPLFYQLLRAHGVLGQDAPPAIEMFSGRGQPSCEQLIDRYRIACRPVRDVLVDYLRERQPSVDFSSLQRLAYLLGKLFWADLEAHHPGIDSLQLPRDVAAAWKQRVMTRTRTSSTPDGQQVAVTSTRLDGRSVLTAVRAFYLDIAEWADDDPARWGPWAVRCPVSASDVSHKKDRSQRKARMDARTRERLPVLPALVAWVQAERDRTAGLLTAAEHARPGDLFTVDTTTLRRSAMKTPTTGRIWAEDPEHGPRRDLTFEEHRGFWTWAVVEVLRHTGMRIEELTELSHHSLIQYRLPATGELIPLLQIIPSKTDTERLLVISARTGRRALARSSPGSETAGQPCRWWSPTTRTNASRTHPCHCCSIATAPGEPGRLGDVAARLPRPRPDRYRRQGRRRSAAALHPPRLPQAVHHRRDPARDATAHRPTRRRTPRHQHHHGIQGRLPRRGDQRAPGVHRPAPRAASQRGIPGPHRRGMGGVPRPLRTPQGRRRRLRPLLRHPLHPRTRLPALPLLRPDPAPTPPAPDPGQPASHASPKPNPTAGSARPKGCKVSLAGARDKLAQMDQIDARRTSTTHLGIPTFTDTTARTVTTTTLPDPDRP